MKTSWTLAELAEHLGAALDGDPAVEISGPAGLELARAGEVSFLVNPQYAKLLQTTGASAVVTGTDTERPAGGPALLRCEDPNSAFTAAVELFAVPQPLPPPGVDARAHCEPGAELGADVSIGPGCFVAAGARIGDRSVLYPGVHVSAGAVVGPDCVLHPAVVLYGGVELGARCVLHGGVVIGADGFGYDFADGAWQKVPQLGSVQIEDDVEIGANSAIDRGRFGATVIGAGSKLDNMVHVAHNCVIGRGVLLVAQVGIAGSAKIGDGAIFGGQAGAGGHVNVAPGVRIAGGSGVIGNIDEPGDYLGFPARPRRQTLRAWAAPRTLEKLARRVEALEAQLAERED